MQLAERGARLSNGLWVRELRKCTNRGHQTSILCTDYSSGTLIVGIFDNARNRRHTASMPTELVTRLRDITPSGNLIEMVIWRVPTPVAGCTHDYKYRLAFIVDGRRVLGFDNERGKGDHYHVGGRERPYSFISIDALTEEFIAEVEKWRNEH